MTRRLFYVDLLSGSEEVSIFFENLLQSSMHRTPGLSCLDINQPSPTKAFSE